MRPRGPRAMAPPESRASNSGLDRLARLTDSAPALDLDFETERKPSAQSFCDFLSVSLRRKDIAIAFLRNNIVGVEFQLTRPQCSWNLIDGLHIINMVGSQGPNQG